jgi:uncharacterized protein
MDITPVVAKSKQLITGYGKGGFKINQEWVEGSLLVLPDRYVAWPCENYSSDPVEAFMRILPEIKAIELLIVGLDPSFPRPPDLFRQALRDLKISLEIMNTGAACRTYSVLLSEERKVGALIHATI